MTDEAKNKRELWAQFEVECKACWKCPLSEGRTHVVVGRGCPETAKVLFIGEGPGKEEDLTGKAFVGAGGKLLDLLLRGLRFSEADYYIANIVKCRPPNNRDPSDAEMQACLPWLRWQVKSIAPKIIVCLGRIAAAQIMDKNFMLTKQRGIWLKKADFDILATWHPAAVLRNPGKKITWFDDLVKVKTLLNGETQDSD